jgi:hypothetical protein
VSREEGNSHQLSVNGEKRFQVSVFRFQWDVKKKVSVFRFQDGLTPETRHLKPETRCPTSKL